MRALNTVHGDIAKMVHAHYTHIVTCKITIAVHISNLYASTACYCYTSVADNSSIDQYLVVGIPRKCIASLHRNSLMLDRSTLRPSALLLYGVGPAPCAAPVSTMYHVITSTTALSQYYVSYTCSASPELSMPKANESRCTTLLCST
jgi:hypothetical protein